MVRTLFAAAVVAALIAASYAETPSEGTPESYQKHAVYLASGSYIGTHGDKIEKFSWPDFKLLEQVDTDPKPHRITSRSSSLVVLLATTYGDNFVVEVDPQGNCHAYDTVPRANKKKTMSFADIAAFPDGDLLLACKWTKKFYRLSQDTLKGFQLLPQAETTDHPVSARMNVGVFSEGTILFGTENVAGDPLGWSPETGGVFMFRDGDTALGDEILPGGSHVAIGSGDWWVATQPVTFSQHEIHVFASQRGERVAGLQLPADRIVLNLACGPDDTVFISLEVRSLDWRGGGAKRIANEIYVWQWRSESAPKLLLTTPHHERPDCSVAYGPDVPLKKLQRKDPRPRFHRTRPWQHYQRKSAK